MSSWMSFTRQCAAEGDGRFACRTMRPLRPEGHETVVRTLKPNGSMAS